ncbi:hypothetical protein M9H77_25001 [Catharanthus roseus]|uniref:Uncharacterized protein n=1 Tax=Catharanthus roseus TaxID=4058 RepID=A0ACC0A878_CATRO|nr:hypothetical protein M9H77_25001 [Catharanthus roseus]
MAIKGCYRSCSGTGDFDDNKVEMTLEEFKKWLMRFDENKDGRISRQELQDAMRATGVWFSRFKSKDGLKSADKNHDGFIDGNEINNLKEFALKHLGVKLLLIN